MAIETNKINEIRSENERHVENIKDRYSDLYGKAILRSLSNKSTIHTGDMDIVRKYISGYESNLAELGIDV